MNEMPVSTILVIVCISLVGIGLITWMIRDLLKQDRANKIRQKERVARIEQMKIEYMTALKGNDKAKALELGRLYYQSSRPGGVLTIYDEQALTNDLSTMQ